MGIDKDELNDQSDAEKRGQNLEPDDSPEKGKAGDLSDVDPEGRDKIQGPPVEDIDEEVD